ncbi:MAG: hypothetical protein JST35_02845 [Armatimonadetes bacterium]|nr:hypothetical protein [Armatimonadota bacterium]
MARLLWLPVLFGLAALVSARSISDYDVVWTTPSKDSSGSMPIGNGEVALNVWVEAATGDVVFLIGRSDALSEISRILKLGRVRVHLDPPLLKGQGFNQRLRLQDGLMEFNSEQANLKLWVDSREHVIRISGATRQTVSVSAKLEVWRTSERTLPKSEMVSAWSFRDAPFPLVESADVVEPSANGITWFHHNAKSMVPRLWENQSIQDLPGLSDPLQGRTFGGRISGPGFKLLGKDLVHQPTASFDLAIATHTTTGIQPWRSGLARLGRGKPEESLKRTKSWWNSFWDRSFVLVQEDPQKPSKVTQAYLLQRYSQAVQGRSENPIKFNGGTLTVEPTPMGINSNPDFRKWGDAHWFQNVRHTVHPMLASGDFEMMESFFALYERNRMLCEARTRKYYGADGVYFPETMSVYGTYSGGDYGWDRTGLRPQDVQCPWWDDAWNQGLELSCLMLDRWEFTGDDRFLKSRVLPMAESVLRYFDTRFKRDAGGKIILDPTQVVETYWKDVKNDMPSVAGLRTLTRRLVQLPPTLVPTKLRAYFQKMLAACPEMPFETEKGLRKLAPAQAYNPEVSNCENGELYAVWPFGEVRLGRESLMQEAKNAYQLRKNKLDTGWGYDGNVAAMLGMADEAARILLVKVANSHPGYRWPATWGPNFDWLPDQNHGGNLLNTTNLMLIQSDPMAEGGAIRLFPAWPMKWDVKFKLHAIGRTTVEAELRGGKLVSLKVTPRSARNRIVLPTGISLP